MHLINSWRYIQGIVEASYDKVKVAGIYWMYTIRVSCLSRNLKNIAIRMCTKNTYYNEEEKEYWYYYFSLTEIPHQILRKIVIEMV